MALQDLTPQLRTRLSRIERAVGWFVLLAILLLASGFAYYVYNMAKRKGWFLVKAPYYTFIDSATGIKVGDPVMLMGFDAGTITKILPMPGDNFQYNVYVQFVLKAPNEGYMWTEGSRARIATADFLGKRVLEVTKGSGGYPTYIYHPLKVVTIDAASSLPNFDQWRYAQEIYAPDGTNLLASPLEPLQNLSALKAAGHHDIAVVLQSAQQKTITAMWNYKEGRYEPYTNNVSEYWLLADESPAVTERLEKVMSQIEETLPSIFSLTNQLSRVLNNSAEASSNLNVLLTDTRPLMSNLVAATSHLDQPGGLGQWLLPTNLNTRLDTTLTSAGATLDSANTNLTALVQNLSVSLDNLAGITSNLNAQVNANTNILVGVSQTVRHADELIQGLKRHWLLRSAFKAKPAPKVLPKAPPGSAAPQPTPGAARQRTAPGKPLFSPKEAGR